MVSHRPATTMDGRVTSRFLMRLLLVTPEVGPVSEKLGSYRPMYLF